MARATRDEAGAEHGAILTADRPVGAEPRPEHRRLGVFVGAWTLEGRQYSSPFGAAATVTALESYEWLTGGLFLMHRLEGRLGEAEMACIEIIGYDTSRGTYPIHSFYNNGTSAEWQAREEDDTWTLNGEWPVGGRPLRVRCTTQFNGDKTRTGQWEYSSDGASWETFWDVKATRVG